MSGLFWHKEDGFLVRATRPSGNRILVRGIILDDIDGCPEGWKRSSGCGFTSFRKEFTHIYDLDEDGEWLPLDASKACQRLVAFFKFFKNESEKAKLRSQNVAPLQGCESKQTIGGTRCQQT